MEYFYNIDPDWIWSQLKKTEMRIRLLILIFNI